MSLMDLLSALGAPGRAVRGGRSGQEWLEDPESIGSSLGLRGPAMGFLAEMGVDPLNLLGLLGGGALVGRQAIKAAKMRKAAQLAESLGAMPNEASLATVLPMDIFEALTNVRGGQPHRLSQEERLLELLRESGREGLGLESTLAGRGGVNQARSIVRATSEDALLDATIGADVQRATPGQQMVAGDRAEDLLEASLHTELGTGGDALERTLPESLGLGGSATVQSSPISAHSGFGGHPLDYFAQLGDPDATPEDLVRGLVERGWSEEGSIRAVRAMRLRASQTLPHGLRGERPLTGAAGPARRDPRSAIPRREFTEMDARVESLLYDVAGPTGGIDEETEMLERLAYGEPEAGMPGVDPTQELSENWGDTVSGIRAQPGDPYGDLVVIPELREQLMEMASEVDELSGGFAPQRMEDLLIGQGDVPAIPAAMGDRRFILGSNKVAADIPITGDTASELVENVMSGPAQLTMSKGMVDVRNPLITNAKYPKSVLMEMDAARMAENEGLEASLMQFFRELPDEVTGREVLEHAVEVAKIEDRSVGEVLQGLGFDAIVEGRLTRSGIDVPHGSLLENLADTPGGMKYPTDIDMLPTHEEALATLRGGGADLGPRAPEWSSPSGSRMEGFSQGGLVAGGVDPRPVSMAGDASSRSIPMPMGFRGIDDSGPLPGLTITMLGGTPYTGGIAPPMGRSALREALGVGGGLGAYNILRELGD